MLWPYATNTGWDLPVELSRVSTPIEECVIAPVGDVDPDLVRLLERRDFDQCPVGRPGSIIGIVGTTHLRDLMAEGRPLTADDPEISFPKVEVVSPLQEVLRTLTENAAAIVVFDTGEWDGDPHEYLGLVTISDLNRHGFRSVVYTLLADLEAALARLLDHVVEDPWEWIRLLPEERQAVVLGHWELAKRRGVDIGPIAATTLTDLLVVAANSERLRGLLRYPSKAQAVKVTGAIPNFRNSVMHPVRPMVLGTSGIETLQSLLDRVIDLTSRAVDVQRSTVEFINDDPGYLRWTADHQNGYVVNAAHPPRPGYLVLHRARCATITGTPSHGSAWTKDYIKLCSLRTEPLDHWAAALGGRLQHCRLCQP